VHGRAIAEPERHDVDDRPVRAIAAVGLEIDEAGEAQPADPQIPLLLAGADDEVGHRALSEHHARQAPEDALLVRHAGVRHGLEELDDQRVVEVGHVPHGQLRHGAQELRRQLLGDHDVMASHGPEQDVEVLPRGGQPLDARVVDHAGRRRGQRDLAVPREHPGQLERADGRTGHRAAHRLARDDENPRQRGAHAVRRRALTRVSCTSPRRGRRTCR
jgi:hypothetical protein